jgi:N-acetylglucosaminyldiphosphoundecaprenol N-acetyl-beta-D-mannosaminyltransferase
LNQNSDKINVLGLNFPYLNYQYSLEIFKHWVTERTYHQVCVANVHTTVLCLNDEELRDITNNSLVTMDGLPLVWYANLVHNSNIKERVCGPELMLRCFDQGRAYGWKHFFLGGTEEVLNNLVSNMKSCFPGVNIVGWHSPPFRPLSPVEDEQLVDLINSNQPDFLWVGLGAPKQEKWIAVGAAFNFHSGHLKRSPVWMQKTGLEWLYRMSQEPRLIKRYFSTNPVFLFLFLRDFIKKLFG